MAYTKQTQCKQGHEYVEGSYYVATHADGRQYRQCRICHRADQKQRYDAMTPDERAAKRKSFPSTAKMKDYQRKYRFRVRYGISVEDAKELLIEQDGLCGICYDKPATNLDHDHVAGRVRGWLCWDCNVGLGKLGDTREGVESALAYLKGE